MAAPPPPPPGKPVPGAPAPPGTAFAPPPPKGPPPTGPAFEFSREDVEAAAEDLMAGLPPPAQVKAEGAPHAVAIVGPKGGKTIASIAVKTAKCPGLPRPAGSIVVVIHLDNQASNSFANFLYEQGIELEPSERPYFIPVGRPQGRYRARVSQSDPACSAYVRDVVFEIERRLGKRGDVGLLVFDGYGDFCNRYGNYVAAYMSGESSPLKLEGTQWTARREFFTDNISNGLGAVCLGGWFIINGPAGGLESEAEKEPSKLRKRLKKEGWGDRQPPAKWCMYRENLENVSVLIETEVGMDLTADKPTAKYLCEVWEGRIARLGLKTGAEANITGRSIAALIPPGTLLPSPTLSPPLPPPTSTN